MRYITKTLLMTSLVFASANSIIGIVWIIQGENSWSLMLGFALIWIPNIIIATHIVKFTKSGLRDEWFFVTIYTLLSLILILWSFISFFLMMEIR